MKILLVRVVLVNTKIAPSETGCQYRGKETIKPSGRMAGLRGVGAGGN